MTGDRVKRRRQLEEAFREAVVERSCWLLTVVGESGVGKSLLAAELIDRIGPEARVLRGRCLSYGEGITYWAICTREGRPPLRANGVVAAGKAHASVVNLS